MLYPEKSMVNMMESSLAESMVPSANNIYDPMVSSLTHHPAPGPRVTDMPSLKPGTNCYVSRYVHTEHKNAHSGFQKKLVKIFSFPTQEMMNVI